MRTATKILILDIGGGSTPEVDEDALMTDLPDNDLLTTDDDVQILMDE